MIKDNKTIIIVNILGGLGNQMFQYAFGRSLSIKNNQPLKLDITAFKNDDLRDFELSKFNCRITIAKETELKKLSLNSRYKRVAIKKMQQYTKFSLKYYTEKKVYTYDPNVFNSRSTYFSGYWQSFRYFENIRDTLIEEFSLKEPLDKINDEILKQVQESNSVSLHIRRGDYVNLSKKKNGHALLPLDYYHKAISYINNNTNNPHFFIFSDDIKWVKENLKIGYKTEYVDINKKEPEKDLILIKNCNHNIIANSSFSWWGAWLNQNNSKLVITPSKWLNNKETPRELIIPQSTIIEID